MFPPIHHGPDPLIKRLVMSGNGQMRQFMNDDIVQAFWREHRKSRMKGNRPFGGYARTPSADHPAEPALHVRLVHLRLPKEEAFFPYRFELAAIPAARGFFRPAVR